MNNKGTDLIVQLRRLICAFVARIWQKQVFPWHGSYNTIYKLIKDYDKQMQRQLFKTVDDLHLYFVSNIFILNFSFDISKSCRKKDMAMTSLWRLYCGFLYPYCMIRLSVCLMMQENNWAATWQNQQNGCAPSEDSDQPGHPPSLIRVFAGCSMGS